MGQCKGKGYFMHFSTESVEPGESASLESCWLYPKAGAQCLQFFLPNTGAADDVLNIWVKEYDPDSPSGKLKLFKSISGGVMGSWELHNVNLNVTQKARVVFEGVRGKSTSYGGFSIDDINLSSTQCPQHIWHIRNMTNLLATTPAGIKLYSPCFLSPSGYSFQPEVAVSMAAGYHCPDGSTVRYQQINMHGMVTTDPNKMSSDGTEYYWDDPRNVGSKVTMSDSTLYYRGPGYGTSTFITHSRLMSRKFIKGDDAFFLLSLEDISGLLVPPPLPQSAARSPIRAENQSAPQEAASKVAVAVGACVVVAMMVIAMMVDTIWRLTRRRGQLVSSDSMVVQDTPGFMDSEHPTSNLASPSATP